MSLNSICEEILNTTKEAYINGSNNGYNNGYNEGYNEGKTQGMTEGYEQGEQAEYNRFWDEYQKNGSLTNYDYAFSGERWTIESFKPKHDIRPNSAGLMFAKSNLGNLTQLLTQLGIQLDTSKSENMQETFKSSKITHIPAISLESAKLMRSTFSFCENLVEIDEIILKSDGTNTFNSPFSSCTSLQKVIFKGVIGNNGLVLGVSPLLTIESLRSVISCLKDYSQDTSGTVWKVSIGSTNLAKLTQNDLDNISMKGWTFV